MIHIRGRQRHLPNRRCAGQGENRSLRPGADDITSNQCAIISRVRQLITRLDDELLAKLKERAAAEGRSVNALVTDMLESQLAVRSPKVELRLRGAGHIVRPPRPTRIPSRESLRRASLGWGSAVSEALIEERAAS